MHWQILWQFLLFLNLGLSSNVLADSTTDHMTDATVRVLCVGNNNKIGTGSGFVVGNGNYVVSNWHVVECTANSGQALILLDAARNSKVKAQVKAHDVDKDLAVLRLESSSGRPAVRFAGIRSLDRGDTATAVGFPSVADTVGGSAAFSEPTMTIGIISRILYPPTNRNTTTNMPRRIQISAPISPGNSGGPVFDDYGQVIGVSTLKALARVDTVTRGVQRVSIGEGIGWAVVSDEIVPILQRLNIAYTINQSRPNALQRLWHQEPLIVILLSILMLMTLSTTILAVTPKGRTIIKDSVTRMSKFSSYKMHRPISKQQYPVLRGLTGPYSGKVIQLHNGKAIFIGRDPAMAQLIFPKDQPKVSKRHASIHYNPQNHSFELEDCWSSYGTFLDTNQAALTAGQSYKLRSGDRFYLGSDNVGFEVGFESKAALQESLRL